MTVSAERKLGDKIAREIWRDPDYLDDPVLVEYVGGVWQALRDAARVRGELTPELEERFAWEVFLDRDRTVNAYALPGGYMGVNLGLIAMVSSRDELAAVMGHELSHITQRHISRLIGRQAQQTPLVVGAMILGALAARRSADVANAAIVGSQAVAAQSQLNFSRDMEREADRIGYGVMTQAGFQPQGFVTMFDKLQQASRLNDNASYPYLRSHPLTTERIGDMQARQQLEGRLQPVPLMAEPAMMSARARVLSNPGVDALRAMVAEAGAAAFAALPPARQAGVLYGAALASSRLREHSLARQWLDRLSALPALSPQAVRLVRLLAGELAMAGGDASRAESLLDARAVSRAEVMLVAQAQIQDGHAAAASQRLQTWVATHPRDSLAWQTLSSAHAALGQTVRAIRADAESQVAHLEFAAALDRLKAAQQLTRQGGAGTDFIEASIIDTRTRQVELLLREQGLER